MKLSPQGIKFLQSNEAEGGLPRLEAYLDSKGKPTIGFGTIRYKSGVKVKLGDKITAWRAIEEMMNYAELCETSITSIVHPAIITQNQFDALVSFAYNEGIGAFITSTLLKKIQGNPKDKAIEAEFIKWNKESYFDENGQKRYRVSKGLTNRRKRECALYFS